MHHWRKVVPVLISAALVTGVLCRVSLADLAEAVLRLDAPLLGLLTAGLVLGLYFWDAFCLRWLFRQPDRELSYRTALHARGTAYLAGAFNYELGQAVLAWRVASAQHTPLLPAMGRCVLLAIHDGAVLLALGLAGAILSAEQQAPAMRAFCALGLTGLLSVGLFVGWMPQGWRRRLHDGRWGAGLGWWTWGRSLRLCVLRCGYYGILLSYAVLALPLCGVYLDFAVVCSVLPLVLLADGLPISVSGLGTRETALLFLLNPAPPLQAAVLAFSLVWSTGLLTGRAVLGLGHLWLPRWSGAPVEGKVNVDPGDGGHGLCRQPSHG
jgi:hypothetical protein